MKYIDCQPNYPGHQELSTGLATVCPEARVILSEMDHRYQLESSRVENYRLQTESVLSEVQELREELRTISREMTKICQLLRAISG